MNVRVFESLHDDVGVKTTDEASLRVAPGHERRRLEWPTKDTCGAWKRASPLQLRTRSTPNKEARGLAAQAGTERT